MGNFSEQVRGDSHARVVNDLELYAPYVTREFEERSPHWLKSELGWITQLSLARVEASCVHGRGVWAEWPDGVRSP